MKKYHQILKYGFTFLFLTLYSCGDFLNEYSQNLSYVRTVDDLKEILIGNAYMPDRLGSPKHGYFLMMWLDVMDDDIDSHANGISTSCMHDFMKGFHYWQQYPYDDKRRKFYGGNTSWAQFYEHIGAVNIIIEKAEEFKTESPEGYRQVKGEAHFLRAFYYFYLVNIWAKHYEPNTADRDPGVPVKLTSYAEGKGFKRNSVAECYAQIIKDLEIAAESLKGLNTASKRRATELAARIFLSRVYLYMEEYESALEQCEKALAIPTSLGIVDMNTTKREDFVKQIVSAESRECVFANGVVPQAMMQKGGNREFYIVSGDLLEKYDTKNDLRFKYFFLQYKGHYLSEKCIGFRNTPATSIFYKEIYLNKAEALCATGKLPEALECLNELRKKRMKKFDTPAMDEKELINLIREERRKEMCFEGQRWFDLKRYAISRTYPEKKKIRHAYWEQTGNKVRIAGEYELGEYPEDGGWILSFPKYALISNKGALIDNDRPERNYK